MPEDPRVHATDNKNLRKRIGAMVPSVTPTSPPSPNSGDSFNQSIQPQSHRPAPLQPIIDQDSSENEDSGIMSDRDTAPLISETGDYKLTFLSSTTEESSWTIGIQVLFPYLVAGFGMVAAGLLLDTVQHWDVFRDVSEVFILVPSLLGLKGNLEMTLASRLSTAANCGAMDQTSELWKMIIGNIVLTQGQALVVGFLAAVVAVVFGWIPDGVFDVNHALILMASSVVTASLASLVLGLIMVVVVVFSRKCNINPDNVATPIAASLGDLTTLSILSCVCTFFYHIVLGLRGLHRYLIFLIIIMITSLLLLFLWIELNNNWLTPTILVGFMALTPLWIWIAHENKYTREVVYGGWVPIIAAMAISSAGGLILDFTVANYEGIAVFQPVINGIGGNLVAVHASRLSTSLHQVSKPGTLPKDAVHGCPNLFRTFFGKDSAAKTARVLLLLVVPGHLIFTYTISKLRAGHTTITIIFMSFYLSAALLQVFILLFVATWMVHKMWRNGDDPDNCAIPYLTALGDLLGTGLLALAFHALFLIGDRDLDVGD